MPTHKAQKETEVVFYITITCYNWISLFEVTDFYREIYKWFTILKSKGNQINGYVIMPNHLHALVYVNKSSTSINKLVGNGKRFMAYEIVTRLNALNNQELIQRLQTAVSIQERAKGKLHEVFELSFDCKPCYDKKFFLQKLDYIHHNPCSGKWNLADEYVNYPHSSAGFYEKGVQGMYEVDDYRLLEYL